MDNREIARALGRTDGATKVLLHRAIRQLEGIVAEHSERRPGRSSNGAGPMSAGATDFEALLREALTPVEPPADLAARMELTLVSLTELAQEELEAWELSAMRDPRNWVRPAAAASSASAPAPRWSCCASASRHRDAQAAVLRPARARRADAARLRRGGAADPARPLGAGSRADPPLTPAERAHRRCYRQHCNGRLLPPPIP